MLIIDILQFIIKLLIIWIIAFPILIIIISIIKNKSGNTNSTAYSNDDNDDIKSETISPSNSHFKVSVTSEISAPNDAGRKWDDISQSEIDSVKCYGDNMSKHNYKIHARYIPTNRMRTVTVNAFSEADALSQLGPEFIADSATVSFSEYPPPTERQIQYAIYLGIHIPQKCCQHDLSALLDQHTTQPAPTALTEFALSRNLCFSYYSDEPYLIRLIASSLPMQEWIAFALACMFRHINNFWNFSDWEKYMNFGLECMNNTSFINSLKRTHFKEEFLGFEYSKCSHDTVFYKTLHHYIVTFQ